MTCPLVTKSMTSNLRMDGEDPYSTAYVENLLGVILKNKNFILILGIKRMENYPGYC